MAKRRLQVNERGELVERDGTVVGRLTSITVDLDDVPRGGAIGGVKEGQLPLQQKTEGGAGETVRTDPAVEIIWAYWVQRRKPERTALPASVVKMIRRALLADFAVADLKLAIDGLLASTWHGERNLHNLSSIFATKPGGPAFEEQVQTWIARGRDAASVTAPTSDEGGVVAGIIEAAKDTVRSVWGSASPAAQEHLAAAVKTLNDHGIDVGGNPANGRPTFTRRAA